MKKNASGNIGFFRRFPRKRAFFFKLSAKRADPDPGAAQPKGEHRRGDGAGVIFPIVIKM
jgi:hypothetical protein